MFFVIMNGEDEYGNIDMMLYGNYLFNDNVFIGDVNCLVNVDASRVMFVMCVSLLLRVVKLGGSVMVDFFINVVVMILLGCVKIFGVTVTFTDLGGSKKSWRVTAIILLDFFVCDGEVVFSICVEIIDIGNNIGVEVVM